MSLGCDLQGAFGVRFDTDGEEFSRSADLPSIYSCTLAGWVKKSGTLTGGFGSFFNIDFGAGLYVTALAKEADGNFYVYSAKNGGTGVMSSAGGDLGSSWHHVAFTISASGASGITGYFDGNAVVTNALDATFTAAAIRIGRGNDGDNINGCVCNFRVWGRPLAANEIRADMQSWARPVEASRIALNSWHKLQHFGDIHDYSGRGNLLTPAGTLSSDTGPPVSPSAPRRRQSYVLLDVDANAGAGGGTAVPVFLHHYAQHGGAA